MAFFNVKFEGMEKVLNNLKVKEQAVREEVAAEFEAAAWRTAQLAKQNAPKDMSFLTNAITTKQIGEISHEVVVQKFYAPYVEFGTGKQAAQYLASQDPELRSYAMQFYVNGEGRMKPRPFLNPALEVAKKELIENLKRILK